VSVAAADVLDVLEEAAVLDAVEELLLGQEPVLPAVRLTRALAPRRRRDGDFELRQPLDERLDQRSLAGSRRSRDDEDHVAGQLSG